MHSLWIYSFAYLPISRGVHVDFSQPPIDPRPPATIRRPCSALETGAISTPASRSVVPLITRRQPSTVRPQRPCNVPYFARRGRDTRADRAPRPNRVASRRNVAPRGPERPHPMSRAAHRRWVRSGRFRRDATGCDSRARPSRRTRTTSERVRVSRPSASTASRPRPPASAGLLDRPSHRFRVRGTAVFFSRVCGSRGTGPEARRRRLGRTARDRRRATRTVAAFARSNPRADGRCASPLPLPRPARA